jgi:hypothetical protein
MRSMRANNLSMNNTNLKRVPLRNSARAQYSTVTTGHSDIFERRFSQILFAVGLSLLLLVAGNAHADIDRYRLYLAQRGDIPWQSLSQEEQEALQRYRNQWDSYDGKRQQEMRRGAQRYMELPPQKRREVEQQRNQYQQLTPEERRRLREEYQRQKR